MTDEQKRQLADYIQMCRHRSFTWGKWDCSLFVADVLAILTGNDFGAPFREQYNDRDGAISILPCRLRKVPEYICGLRQCAPKDGAVWWGPGTDPQGALGIFWQGRILQPGRRGLKTVFADISTLTFYS